MLNFCLGHQGNGLGRMCSALAVKRRSPPGDATPHEDFDEPCDKGPTRLVMHEMVRQQAIGLQVVGARLSSRTKMLCDNGRQRLRFDKPSAAPGNRIEVGIDLQDMWRRKPFSARLENRERGQSTIGQPVDDGLTNPIPRRRENRLRQGPKQSLDTPPALLHLGKHDRHGAMRTELGFLFRRRRMVFMPPAVGNRKSPFRRLQSLREIGLSPAGNDGQMHRRVKA